MLDEYFKDLPPPTPPGPMAGSTAGSSLDDRAVRQLYLNGPCSHETLMGLVGEQSMDAMGAALKRINSKVSTRPVTLPGRADPVVLVYLRGGGIG